MGIKKNQARIRNFRTCHQQHHYRYNDLIQKKVTPRALWAGKLGHEILERMSRNKPWDDIILDYSKDYEKLMNEEKEEYVSPEDLKRVFQGYSRHYSEKDSYRVLEDSIEKTITMELIPGRIMFKGRIDGIAKDPHGRKWLLEHKTFTKMPSEDFRFTSMQTAMYSYVLENSENILVDGILFDYIKMKAPTIPQLLKAGGLSKRDIDTDYYTYHKTVLDNKLNPRDYEDILSTLKEKKSTFYIRSKTPTPEIVKKNIIEDFIVTCIEIEKLGELSKTKSLGKFTCNMCEYALICRAELSGLDVDFIKRNSYKPVEDPYAEDTNAKEV